MKLGFHYHIPVYQVGKRYFTQSTIGLFIDSLAAETEELHVVYYAPTEAEIPSMTYQIEGEDIYYYPLGIHDSAPKRLLRIHQSISVINQVTALVDYFILRAPTPLSLALPFIRHKRKMILYLVGNYVKNSKNLIFNPLKNTLIKGLSYSVEFANKQHLKNSVYLTNSQEIIDDHSGYAKGILIKTTTLKQEDFFSKRFQYTDTRPLKVLFVGRIDKSKGVFEIVDACKLLSAQGIHTEIHVAGSPEKGNNAILGQMQQQLIGFENTIRLVFHGQLKNGQELNSLYRSCDLFILASISEGFPRTIWEAMANSLPVIATKVGAIPHFLSNGRDAILLDDRSPETIAEKIGFMVSNPEEVNKQILNAAELVKDLTLEKQARRIIQTLETINEQH
jgi:glycosyltransferase involved in cell wall biosynthesis